MIKYNPVGGSEKKASMKYNVTDKNISTIPDSLKTSIGGSADTNYKTDKKDINNINNTNINQPFFHSDYIIKKHKVDGDSHRDQDSKKRNSPTHIKLSNNCVEDINEIRHCPSSAKKVKNPFIFTNKVRHC